MNNHQNHKILFVDDEQNILDALKRQLYKKYQVETALGPVEGLKQVETKGSYVVVVSDMQMPAMNGVQFLTRVKEISPDTIRIILTGNAELNTAIQAVNRNIFRFLTKPCDAEELIQVLDAGIRQYQLIQAERELLEKTLMGSIQSLMEILAITNPAAFSRANRIQYFTKQFVALLRLRDVWQYDVAALLSQIGYITVPPEILKKIYQQEELLEKEKEILKKIPETASQLIGHIPRLELVMQMIRQQEEVPSKEKTDPASLGGAILKIANDLELLLSQGLTKTEIIDKIKRKAARYHPMVLSVLEQIPFPHREKKVVPIKVSELTVGMVIEEEIRGNNGLLLATKGQEISDTLCRLLQNHLRQSNIAATVLASEWTYQKAENQ